MKKKTHKFKQSAIHKNVALQSNEANQLSKLFWVFVIFIFIHFTFVFLFGKTKVHEYTWFTRLWGFDNISFFQVQYIMLAYSIAILTVLPWFNNRIYRFFSREFFFRIFLFIKRFRYVFFVLIGIVSMVVFYSFQIKYHFLGDMDIRVKQTMKMEFIKEEYLLMYLLYHLYHLLNVNFSLSGTEVFVLQSVVAGGGFIILILLIANLLGKNLFEKISIALFSISGGFILLFFGYIEIYSFPAFFVTLYIYFTLLWIKGKTNFILPLLVLIIAVALHMMTIALVPSYIIAFYQKKNHFLGKNISKRSFFIFLAFALPLAYFIAPKLHIGSFMPLKKSETNPEIVTLFSAKHIWEFINSQILASGITLLVIILIAVHAFRRKIHFDPVMWFFASAGFFMLFVVFVSNKMRGSGDWDICAFPALAFMPMVIYGLLNCYTDKQLIRYTVLTCIVLNLLNTVPWVAINAGDKSIKKIASMLEYDVGYYHVTRMHPVRELAMSFDANGLKEEAMKYYKEYYIRCYSDPTSHLIYAIALSEHGEKDKAVPVLSGLIQSVPYIPNAYSMLVSIYQERQQNDKIYLLINYLFQQYQSNPKLFQARFEKNELINYFNYLLSVEMNGNNDSSKIRLLKEILNELRSV